MKQRYSGTTIIPLYIMRESLEGKENFIREEKQFLLRELMGSIDKDIFTVEIELSLCEEKYEDRLQSWKDQYRLRLKALVITEDDE